jgi:hypothetical protein
VVNGLWPPWAIDQQGQGEKIRAELGKAVKAVFDNSADGPSALPLAMRNRITSLAEIVALARAHVVRNNAYLSPEHCDHAEWECPLAALGSDLGRADKAMKARIFGELAKYRSRMLPFMPGRRTADKERSSLRYFRQ